MDGSLERCGLEAGDFLDEFPGVCSLGVPRFVLNRQAEPAQSFAGFRMCWPPVVGEEILVVADKGGDLRRSGRRPSRC